MLSVKSFETKKQIKKSVTNVRELYEYTTYFWCVTVVRMLLLVQIKKSVTNVRELYIYIQHISDVLQ